MNHQIPLYTLELKRVGFVSTAREFGRCARDVVSLYQDVMGVPDRECLLAMYFDAHSRFIGVHTVAVGTAVGVDAHAREVFKAAILSNAVTLALAHNHPSGDPRPSEKDLIITRGLALAGQLLGIGLRDHVIVGDPGFCSIHKLNEAGEALIGYSERYAQWTRE